MFSSCFGWHLPVAVKARLVPCLALSALLFWAVPRSLSQPCSFDVNFNPGLNANAQVYAVALQTNGQILIGGLFSSISNVPIANVARLNADGSLDATFNPGTAANVGYVNAIAVQTDGKVVIGGVFFSSTGVTQGNLARLNPDGTVDADFDPNLYVDDAVNAVLVQTNGLILIGGNFGVVDGMLRREIARLNGDGTLDFSFDACVAASAGSGATALAMLPNGQILASGNFTFNNNVSRKGIARLSYCGELDLSYGSTLGVDTGATAYTFALRSDGEVMLGGNFRWYKNISRPGITRLTSKGAIDFAFNPGTGIETGATVFATALQSDGKVIIGGSFTSYNGQTIYRVARIKPDGSLEAACDPGAGPDNSVSSFAIQSDGKILVAGKFGFFDGMSRNGLARLNGDCRVGPPTRLDNGQVRLIFYGQEQLSYAVQASSNLLDWESVTNFTATSSATPLVDSTATASPKRFYRGVLVP